MTNMADIIRRCILTLVCISLGIVGGMALWYGLKDMMTLRVVLLAAWVCFHGIIMVLTWKKSELARTWLCYGIILLGLVSWWGSIRPSNNRLWADDVSRTVTAEVNGDAVVLHNVRSFHWRTSTDYDIRWEDRRYDLAELESVDLFLSTWGNPNIAHTLVSFGFRDGQHVVFSLEIRKEQGEAFSSVAGFFKQYEQALIAADERDIIYTRTNIRKEDVTRYAVRLTPEQRKVLFLKYLARGNALASEPVFYNTLTANCTTVVFDMVRSIVPGLPLDRRILFSGLLPSYIFDVGGFGREATLEQLTGQGRITKRAQDIQDINDYSRIIRNVSPTERVTP